MDKGVANCTKTEMLYDLNRKTLAILCNWMS